MATTRKKPAKTAEKEAAAAKQEVATVDEASTDMMVAPDFMESGSEGTEALGQSDIELPWVKLLQGTSPGLHDNDWRAGRFLHSILEIELDPEDGPFHITPLVALRPRFMLFNPLDQGGGILARAEDGVHWSPAGFDFKVKINKGTKEVTWRTEDTVAKSGLDKWGSSDPDDPNSGPAADLQYRYICVSPTHPQFGAFIILLQRSGIKAAKRLNALLTGANRPAYGQVIEVASVWEDKGPDDKKFLWKFTKAGFVQEQETYENNRRMFEQFKDADIVVHDEKDTATADLAGDTDVSGTDSDEY